MDNMILAIGVHDLILPKMAVFLLKKTLNQCFNYTDHIIFNFSALSRSILFKLEKYMTFISLYQTIIKVLISLWKPLTLKKGRGKTKVTNLSVAEFP
jgi:hypothetical protein